MSSAFFEELNDILKRGEAAAIAVIIRIEGSTPRKTGARMLIRSDGTISGTIGGGKMEAETIKAALECLKTRSVRLLTFDLKSLKDPDMDLSCGGDVMIFVEPVAPPDRCVIFGGGHVGYAIYSILSTLDFRITIVDDRKSFATRKRFPKAGKIICKPYKDAFTRLSPGKEDYIVICTRMHSSDGQCLEWALKSPAGYVGMLGSKNKVKYLKKKMRDLGIKPKRLSQLHSPIGIEIGAMTPEEIAVSVAAEMIQVRSSRFAAL
ncbi:XdhC family protein [Candidatus Sumerlaeota bacterium]|nr:XdhC family protein [Candidatus Sumerlaeota bacterium]